MHLPDLQIPVKTTTLGRACYYHYKQTFRKVFLHTRERRQKRNKEEKRDIMTGTDFEINITLPT